jgi:drug/metabolite transporter (DMT)-like permease
MVTTVLGGKVCSTWCVAMCPLHDGFTKLTTSPQHALSLPLFIPFLPRIGSTVHSMLHGAHVEMAVPGLSPHMVEVPVEIMLLVINAITQLLCVRGVNLLISTSSALSVCMVLNFRKLLNLFLSVYILRTTMSSGFIFGASLVFSSIILYAIDEHGRKKPSSSNHGP